MSADRKEETLPIKKLLQGSILILISNLIYIGNTYLVSWTKLKATEVTLVRGGLQIFVFGLLVCSSKKEDTPPDPGQKSNRLHLFMLIILFGFSTSTASFACLAAIQFMPIGDIIVVCFSAPIFSVFLDRIVLKRPLSFISISLCLCIVLGDAFVVQPSFLFGDRYDRNQSSNSLENVKDHVSSEKQGKLYYNGVALCFYASAAGAVANVVSTHCYKKHITTSNIMLVSGFSTFLLSLISALFLPNRVLTAPLSLSMEAKLLLPVSALMSMIAYWTLTLAVSITRHPTLVSMLRSTEILISLATESLWWGQLPGSLSLFGSLLVTACILGMAVKEKICRVLDTFWTQSRGRKEDRSLTGNNVHQTQAI